MINGCRQQRRRSTSGSLVRTDLELFDEHRFGNGVVHLRYRVST